MDLFSINMDKCLQDGICAEICPMKIIKIRNGFPEPVNDAKTYCINCGHCVAVCPVSAFSHMNLKPENCLDIYEKNRLDIEQVQQFFLSRRSIRKYKNKQIEKSVLRKIIGIATHSPSGHNCQPVEWHVIYERKRLNQLCLHVIDWMKHMLAVEPEHASAMNLDRVVAGHAAGFDTITREAPHLILVHGKEDEQTSQYACIIAMAWLELTLSSFGLGGCWCGFFNRAAMAWKPLQEALGFPEEHTSFGAMMVGYPKYKYHRIPTRNKPVIRGI